VNFDPLFQGAQIFDSGYYAHFFLEGDEIGTIRDVANWLLFPKFRKLWSGDPAIPCGNMHQSFTDAVANNLLSFVCASIGVLLALTNEPKLGFVETDDRFVMLQDSVDCHCHLVFMSQLYDMGIYEILP